MEHPKEKGHLEDEVFELVLKEILEEQQKSNAAIENQRLLIEMLASEINSICETTRKQKMSIPTLDIKPIEELIQKAMIKMEVKALLDPKNITRQFQILLFPPQDARLFYKIVFGRWLIWLTVMLFITELYKWSIHWSDNQQQIQQYRVENDRVKKAWNYLYFGKDKKLKKFMDSAYSKINL